MNIFLTRQHYPWLQTTFCKETEKKVFQKILTTPRLDKKRETAPF